MRLEIGILTFPGVQQLDLTGPYEVFSSMREAHVHLIWKDQSPIMASSGLVLQPTLTFDNCPKLDVLCVPGGDGINGLMQDADTLDFIRDQAEKVQYITSVCTGALVLGAAGLLKGRRATTHWLSHDFLERFGAIPVQSRVVRDGKMITAGGITAGIDFALMLVAELTDRDSAQAIQLAMEYAPAPPFQAGTPDEAPAAIKALVSDHAAPLHKKRAAIIDRITRS